MRFIETVEITDTDPKGYVGPPKVNKKTGKPLCKNGKEPDEEGKCMNDVDMHKKSTDIPDVDIANKHEEVITMKTNNPILRQELMNLGIILPKEVKQNSIAEESPIRTALNIMKNSPNTIESSNSNKEVNTKLNEAYKHLVRPIDREKAAKEGAAAADRVKKVIADQKKKKSIIW